MRSRILGFLLLVGFALPAIPATADHLSYETAEQCMQSRTVMEGLPTCTNLGDGRWRASHPSDPASDARGMVATIVVLWVILVAGSVWWVTSTARRHGDPVGTALLGALVGGPLFVLMYGSNSDLIRRSRRLYRLTDRLPDHPSPAPVVSSDGDPASRLRELAHLRDEGLITHAEHDDRRREIIDEV